MSRSCSRQLDTLHYMTLVIVVVHICFDFAVHVAHHSGLYYIAFTKHSLLSY